MTDDCTTVYFPIVSNESSHSSLIGIYAEYRKELNEEDIRAIDRDLSPVASPLRRCGLYRPAYETICVARPWMTQQKIELDNLRLHGDGQSAQGKSCQLAIALALMVNNKTIRHPVRLIATGALKQSFGNHVPIIEPVDLLAEKLNFIVSELQQQLSKGQGLLYETWIFVPRHVDAEKQTLTEDWIHKTESKFDQSILSQGRVKLIPVSNLDEVNEHLSRLEPPFLGLSAFSQSNTHWFFGREQEAQEALVAPGWLATDKTIFTSPAFHDFSGYRWLQIEGNSGSGKSSFMYAGLLPVIEKGSLARATGIQDWWLLDYGMPGQFPLTHLADKLNQNNSEGFNFKEPLETLSKLEKHPDALSTWIKSQRSTRGILLIIDQFEELFTLSDGKQRTLFEQQLYSALTDSECPLFVVCTVRIDFLADFEKLMLLSKIYNSHCKRYLLKTLSLSGLRTIIEQPARNASLDVTDLTELMLSDASHDSNALPLVENALTCLYYALEPGQHQLSGRLYREQGGLMGLLQHSADKLLNGLNTAERSRALELMFAMTRINPESQHTRRRISLTEARNIAGDELIHVLSGRTNRFVSGRRTTSNMRIICSTTAPSGEVYYDLVHETLVRARIDDSGNIVPYWPILYEYIEANRNRDLYRQQLELQAQQWQRSKGISRLRHLVGLRQLRNFRHFRPSPSSSAGQMLMQSKLLLTIQALLLFIISVMVFIPFAWTLDNELPLNYVTNYYYFTAIDKGFSKIPTPEFITIPAGSVKLGEVDQPFIELIKAEENESHFGVPNKVATIPNAFQMSIYETTYLQYDYFVWDSRHNGDNKVNYPATGKGGRGNQPVGNVSWVEANRYLQWLSKKTGHSYRLPTEAEWEYAARAGTTTHYWWGNEMQPGKANCNECQNSNDGLQTLPVNSFGPNPFGLYNMAGNINEWTCSLWVRKFNGEESKCVDEHNPHTARVFRGGTYYDAAQWLRSTSRDWDDYVNRDVGVGFRALREIAQ